MVGKFGVMAAAGLLSVIGILLMLNSPTMGLAAADAWLTSIGGSVNSAKYQAMMTAFSDSYRLLGAVLLGGGMFGAFQWLRNISR